MALPPLSCDVERLEVTLQTRLSVDLRLFYVGQRSDQSIHENSHNCNTYPHLSTISDNAHKQHCELTFAGSPSILTASDDSTQLQVNARIDMYANGIFNSRTDRERTRPQRGDHSPVD